MSNPSSCVFQLYGFVVLFFELETMITNYFSVLNEFLKKIRFINTKEDEFHLFAIFPSCKVKNKNGYNGY